MRTMVSCGVPACSVVSDPSCPVFIACSMSMHSAPRTSPTTMRSGRMRRALVTKSRMVTAPCPSIDASRASSLTTWGWHANLSSAESSIVTIRSFFGISQDNALSSVVLPEPVPPATAKSCRNLTAQDSNPAYQLGSDPSLTSSSKELIRSENFRMVTQVPSIAAGGITTLTRYPLGRRALTSGLRSSTRLPKGEMMRSTTIRICSSLSNRGPRG